MPPPAGQDIVQPLSAGEMNQLKRVPAGHARHAGSAECGLIVSVDPEPDGECRIGVVNEQLGIGLEFKYSAAALPRMAHWQHYGPDGCYVSAVEPFHGSLLGAARDRSPLADSSLEPGESRNYKLRIRVLRNRTEIEELLAFDGPVEPIG